jgi:hypothetical protein
MSLANAYIVGKNTRKTNDFYPTPPIATYCLVKNHDVPKTILEPAAGKGWISYELEKNGISTVSKDLYPYEDTLLDVEVGEDFLESEKDARCEGMITNPPFRSNMPEKFIKHSVSLYDFTAIFCRLTLLETPRRGALFEEHPFNRMLVLSSRVNCDDVYFKETKRQLGGMVAYAWFIWDKKSNLNRQIDFVSPKNYLEEFTKLRGTNYE